MIDEIKKEIEKAIEDGQPYVYNETLNAILDKYSNQPKATIFIDSEDMEERYGTQLYIEYLERYKNAWEENKNSMQEKHRNWCVNMSGAETKKEIKTCETYMKYWEEKLEELKELEQKYHLGGLNND